uniref:Alpha/beta fold hydrolase n=1 Tax=Streptomyces sp. NBC_00003 TaxID=2903608 RepID=A0AAU2V5J2_9ACTN
MPPSVATIRRALNTTSYVAPRLAGRYAFRFFCEPTGRAPVRPAEKEVHEAAAVERIVVDGKEVAVYRWGDGKGEPVLLMHGFAMRASALAGFVPGLVERGFTPVAYDAFGHGDSEGRNTTLLDHRALTAALHEKHGPFRAIIGHSFGGTCAYDAVREGVKAERIVSIGALCDFRTSYDTFCAQLGLREGLKKELHRRTEEFFRPETDIWRRFSVSHRPELITARALVVHDRTDREVAFAEAGKIVAALGERSRPVTTEGLGHRRVLTDPSVVEQSLDFVAGGVA